MAGIAGHRLVALTTCAIVAVAFGCTPPTTAPPTTAPPTTAPPTELPVAPMLRLPTSLGVGARAVVLDEGPGDEFGVATMLVDDRSARELDVADPIDAELAAIAFGRVHLGTGMALRHGRELSAATGLYLCDAWSTTAGCRLVPDAADPTRMSFSPDGTKFAVTTSIAGDPTRSRLRIFDVDDLSLVNEAIDGVRGDQMTVPWSPDSSSVALVQPNTVAPPGSGVVPFEGAVSTLAATPGAPPVVVVPSTRNEWVRNVIGWSSAGRLTYKVVDTLDGQMTTLRSVAAVGPASPRVLGEIDTTSPSVLMPDGSVLSTSPRVGGTAVVQRFTDTAPSVVTPLAQRTEPGATYVFGILFGT